MSKLLFRVIVLSAVLGIFAMSQIATAEITDGLVGYWPLDEGSGTTTADVWSGTHNGIVENGATWVTGKIGSALDFTGGAGGGDVSITQHADLMPVDAFSVQAWASWDSHTTTWAGIVSNSFDTGDDESGYILFGWNYDSAWFGQRTNATEYTEINGGTVGTGIWRHLVATYDGSFMRIYVDGSETGSTAKSGPVDYVTEPEELSIGRFHDDNEDVSFDGQIDEVALWNRALTPAEVVELYNGGTGTPLDLVHTAPHDPDPGDGEDMVELGQILSWEAPDAYVPQYYDLLFGTSEGGMVKQLDQVDVLTWDPDTRIGADGNDLYTNNIVPTYYWQVAAYEPNDTPRYSPVWTFETIPAIPMITTEPADGLVAIGYTGTVLSLEQSRGDTYEWFRSTDDDNSTPTDTSVATGSCSGSTVSLDLTTVAVSDESYYYCVITNIDGTATSGTATLETRRLVGHWSLNGNANDSVTVTSDVYPAVNHATVFGAVYVAGESGSANSALKFDGISNYVACAAGTGPRPATAITVSAWAKPDSYNEYGGIAALIHDTDSIESGYFLGTSDAGDFLGGVTGIDGISYLSDGGGNSTTQWSHVVFTNDGSTTRIYVNGLEKASVEEITPIDYDPTSVEWTTFEIGRLYDDDEEFWYKGTIDDVRVYNYGMTTAQVITLYGKPMITEHPQDLLIDDPGVAVFTVSAKNGGSGSYQWYLSSDPNNTPIDDTPVVAPDSNSLTINPAELADEGYYYCKVTISGQSSISNPARLRTRRLVGHWTYDAEDLNDSSPVGANDGTAVGDPNYIAGIVGAKALNLDGNDYVNIDSVAADLIGNEITLSTWVRTTGDGELIAGNTSGGGNVIMLEVWGDVASTDPGEAGTTIVNDGEWHMLTYISNGSEESIYVDGMKEYTGPAGVYTFGITNLWSLGQEYDGGPAASDFLTGQMDDTKIYNYALAEAYIHAAYFAVNGNFCPENDPFDISGEFGVPDCVVDAYDIAEFALGWLECGRVPVSECSL